MARYRHSRTAGAKGGGKSTMLCASDADLLQAAGQDSELDLIGHKIYRTVQAADETHANVNVWCCKQRERTYYCGLQRVRSSRDMPTTRGKNVRASREKRSRALYKGTNTKEGELVAAARLREMAFRKHRRCPFTRPQESINDV